MLIRRRRASSRPTASATNNTTAMATEIQITLDTRPSWHLPTPASSAGQPPPVAHQPAARGQARRAGLNGSGTGRQHAAFAYLVGSRATDGARADSDTDIAALPTRGLSAPMTRCGSGGELDRSDVRRATHQTRPARGVAISDGERDLTGQMFIVPVTVHPVVSRSPSHRLPRVHIRPPVACLRASYSAEWVSFLDILGYYPWCTPQTPASTKSSATHAEHRPSGGSCGFQVVATV
jgi:hypothetical protein